MDLFKAMVKKTVKKLEELVTRTSDLDYEPGAFSLEQLLVGLSHVYKKGAQIRLRAYEEGRKERKRLPCPVISIGNIVAGGAGKTPMAVFVADRLIALGRKPVVISRGYKGTLGEGPAVVGDTESVLLDEEAAGDEPFMMARLKRFPVVVGRDRYAAGKLALEALDVDIIVLDDGFQHLRLARDMDIVLMDCQRPLGNGRMLPAGRLRETPEMCGGRASCLVLTRCPESFSISEAARAQQIPGVFSSLPLFASRHRPVLAHWKGGGSPSLADLAGRSALLFSGIARNDSFARSAWDLGIKVAAHLEFRDHYRYKRADFFEVRRRAKALGADLILTTEKDWVKVDHSFDFGTDIGVMGISITLEDVAQFDRLIRQKALAQ